MRMNHSLPYFADMTFVLFSLYSTCVAFPYPPVARSSMAGRCTIRLRNDASQLGILGKFFDNMSVADIHDKHKIDVHSLRMVRHIVLSLAV